MYNLLENVSKAVTFLIAPPYCSYCRQWLVERVVFCGDCKLLVSPIVSDYISVRNYTVPILAVSNYQDPIKKMVLAKLYSNRTAALKLGELIWECTVIKDLDFDYIVPIPLHWTRFLKRGYNQAEVMASVISKKSKKPILNILKRRKRTSFQFLLSKQDRYKNLNNVFDIKKQKFEIQNKRILLVDDLMTTGSTMKEACLEISKAMPADIKAVVACRVV
jgi:ComF family protein